MAMLTTAYSLNITFTNKLGKNFFKCNDNNNNIKYLKY